MAFAAIFGVAALALGMQVAGVEGQLVFVVAGVGVAGLAWALGEATEQAGGTAGPRVSALLNASFGNLPELVILVLAINAGLADIARASIIGSVIGNVLLILGLALLLGGWRHGVQRFNERMAGTNASMLILGVVGLGLPTLFHAVDPDMQAELTLSRFTAAALLLCYVAYVYFSFTTPGLQFHDEPGVLAWSRTQAVTLLVATAVATGVVSEVLVHSIEPTIKAWGVPREFIGLIVVPFVGNVAEHFSAVRLAINNRMDFAMGIAFGSGIQISLLASAVAVFASMLIGKRAVAGVRPAAACGAGGGGDRRDDGGAVGRDQLAGGAAAAGHLLHRGGGVLAAVTVARDDLQPAVLVDRAVALARGLPRAGGGSGTLGADLDGRGRLRVWLGTVRGGPVVDAGDRANASAPASASDRSRQRWTSSSQAARSPQSSMSGCCGRCTGSNGGGAIGSGRPFRSRPAAPATSPRPASAPRLCGRSTSRSSACARPGIRARASSTCGT